MSTSVVARDTGMGAAPGVDVSMIDCDVHNEAPLATFLPYLDRRWRAHAESFGLRTRGEPDAFPGLRTPSRRIDAIPPGGGLPGSDPAFAKDQLLDEFGIDIAILQCSQGQTVHIGYNQPAAFSAALARATNDWTMEAWLQSDPRWRATIHSRIEEPRVAEQEIRRCVESSTGFVQIAVSPRTERPLGHQKYWDLFDIATNYGLPLSMHPGGTGGNAGHASGAPSTFYELHTGFHFGVMGTIGSLIFEGVFDRWPTLKIVVIESGWSWVAPLAWRLDATWRVLRSEVPDLQRKPSEYIADHFWFTTQPMESPENPKWFNSVYEQFEDVGLKGHLLFSTDYPHWDFDSPEMALPSSVPASTRREIFAENAAALYGFRL